MVIWKLAQPKPKPVQITPTHGSQLALHLALELAWDLDAFRPIRAHSGPLGPIRAHSGPFGPIRADSGPFGPIRGPFEALQHLIVENHHGRPRQTNKPPSL